MLSAERWSQCVSEPDEGKLEGSIAARVAWTQGDQASLAASAQKAKGLKTSIKREKASKEGTAVRLMEICSARPSGDWRCTISILRPGRWATALVASVSLGCMDPLPTPTVGPRKDAAPS